MEALDQVLDGTRRGPAVEILKKFGSLGHTRICESPKVDVLYIRELIPELSGGGNVDNIDLDKFGPALRWMTYEAVNGGLRMMPFDKEWVEYKSSESLTLGWRILEILPLGRLTYKTEEGVTRRYVHQRDSGRG
jgi:hypothetical protein